MEGEKPIGQLISENFRNIPDFPKEGIVFKDISPLLSNVDIFRKITQAFADALKDVQYDKLVVLESRGFIFGSALSLLVNKGIVLIRKKGKLPGKVVKFEYNLEYGTDAFEIQEDAIAQGERVVIIDDILAVGGTSSAAVALVEKIGGTVAALAFLYSIKDLNGVSKLPGKHVITLHSE